MSTPTLTKHSNHVAHPEKCVRVKRNGERCKNSPRPGTTVCAKHGAKNPRISATADVRAKVLRWGLGDIGVEPGEVLLRLLTQSIERVEAYAVEMAELVKDSPTLRSALVREAWGEFGPTGEYVRGMVELEARERRECADLALKAVRAGLAERQTRLAEQQGAMIAVVLRAVLGDARLGLSADQLAAAPMIIDQHVATATADQPNPKKILEKAIKIGEDVDQGVDSGGTLRKRWAK